MVELHAGLHRAREKYWSGPFFKKRALPIIGDRHQVAGRRHDHATASLMGDLSATRGVKVDARSSLKLSGGNCRLSLNMLDAVSASSPKKISKTLLDPVHGPVRRSRPRTIHVRPLRPRAVARGPQVGLHPARGATAFRRRAAERRC